MTTSDYGKKMYERLIKDLKNEDPTFEAKEVCNKIRLDRRKKYGDTWKDNKEYQLMALVKEKVGRLEFNFEHPNEKSYETKEDTLIDLINWATFYLQNLKDGKYNEDRNS